VDALMRKVGLPGVPGKAAPGSTSGSKTPEKTPDLLSGRVTALLDIGTRLPHRVWIEPEAAAHN
jgi:hypothetical protein